VSDLPLEPVTPYIGLIPYAEQDAPFFFGRERERAMITANLMASRLTVLYGPSGAGKSSVLRAGVEHTLREQAQRNLEEHGEPELAVVVFSNWRDNPIVGLSLAVHEAVKRTLATMNLADDSSPVPHDLVESLEAWTKRLNGELLIILDQFEEYFLYHAQEDGEGTFAVEFPRAVNSIGLRVNFLVSLREDALSKLDRFKGRIPNLFDNYLRIAHLSRDAARDAIEKPLEEYNRRQTYEADRVTIEPALVEAVLSQVQTGRVTLAREGSGSVGDSHQPVESTIETSYLQLVMMRLWDEEIQAGSHTLQLMTLNRLEGAEHIVRTHLDSVMNSLSPDERDIAAEVFRYLVTPSGTKIAYTVTDLVAYTRTSSTQLISVLERLSGSGLRVLRTVDPPPDQPRETRYEIFHDVLAAAILDWRGRYMQEKEKRELERHLAEEAEKQRASELAAARQRELETQVKASRRLRWLTAALVIVSLIAVVAAVSAWNSAQLAQKKQGEAESAAAQLNTINQELQQAAKMSGEQEVAARATAQVASTLAANLRATSVAGAQLPPATATAQAAAAQAAATQAVAAQATAQAAVVQATAQAAAAQSISPQATTQAPVQTTTRGDVWINADVDLNLRSDPDPTSSLITLERGGSHLIAIGPQVGPDASGYVWQQVRTDSGQLGWVVAIGPTGTHLMTRNPEATITAEVPQSQSLGGAGVGHTLTRAPDGMVMVYVPAGTFKMGSDTNTIDERPVHDVTLDAFWIDRTEVTNAQYTRCVAAGVCREPISKGSRTQPSYYDNSGFANHPVIWVSWEDADKYCRWVGGQLPTEAQWEYAARGPQALTYPWGIVAPNDKLLNYNQIVGDTTSVGSYPSGASWSGALDMAGNVSEWVNDWYGSYSDSPQINPTGSMPDVYRVLRGFSWFYGPTSVRSSNRINALPTDRTDDFGFRCAVSLGQ
jgi:formylglycine-generating enzyme required for sulfatase activity